MLKHCCIQVIFAAFLTGSGISVPAAVRDYCSRPLRVALFEFGLLYKASTDDGIDQRLLATLEKRTGCTFERAVLPRNRIWTELQNGSLDLATAAIPSPERKAYAYLLPYLRSRNRVLLQSAIADKAQTMAEFEAGAFRLGVVRGFRHEPAYDQFIARLARQGRIVEAADVTEDFRMLERGMVDGVLSQPIVYRQYLEEDYLQTRIATRDWAPADEFAIGALILSRRSFTPQQARHWDALLVALQRDGSLLKIFRGFLAPVLAADLVYQGPRTPD